MWYDGMSFFCRKMVKCLLSRISYRTVVIVCYFCKIACLHSQSTNTESAIVSLVPRTQIWKSSICNDSRLRPSQPIYSTHTRTYSQGPDNVYNCWLLSDKHNFVLLCHSTAQSYMAHLVIKLQSTAKYFPFSTSLFFAVTLTASQSDTNRRAPLFVVARMEP